MSVSANHAGFFAKNVSAFPMPTPTASHTMEEVIAAQKQAEQRAAKQLADRIAALLNPTSTPRFLSAKNIYAIKPSALEKSSINPMLKLF